jgi:hypothetical protein
MENVVKSILKLNKIHNKNYEFAIYEPVNNEQDYVKYVKYISGKTEKNNAIFSNTQPYTWQEISTQFPQVELDIALDNLRIKRNKLLIDSDYVVLADSPITDKANWITYRQALRDITEGLDTVEKVNNVAFPKRP